MTVGFECNGPCGLFYPLKDVAAEVTFRCFVRDDGTPMAPVTTQVCPECVPTLLTAFGPDRLDVLEGSLMPRAADEYAREDRGAA